MVTQTSVRQISFLVIGSLLILIGAMIGGRVERGLGVDESGFWVAVVIAFFLILAGGFFWILVAVVTHAELTEFE